MLPRGERPNPLREKNVSVNGFVRSWLPRLGQQAQFLDVSKEFIHSDGTIIPQEMFDFLHLTLTGYRIISKPLSELLLQILEETPEERRASLVWVLRSSSTFTQRHASPCCCGRHVPGVFKKTSTLSAGVSGPSLGSHSWVKDRGAEEGERPCYIRRHWDCSRKLYCNKSSTKIMWNCSSTHAQLHRRTQITLTVVIMLSIIV